MLRAEELHRRGVDAINTGRVRRARALLERAAERADSEEILARIEASLAYVAAETGDPDHALLLCQRALARAELSPGARGVVLSQQALLLMRRGETADALVSFDAAIGDLAESPADLGKAHLNRGGVFLQRGDPVRAAQDFAAAADELAGAGEEVEAAKARHNLGYTHMLTGNLVDALAELDAARTVLAPLSPVSRAIGEQDRAEVLMAAGLVTEGRQALREAANALASRRLQQRRGEAELALARSLVVTDPGAALAAARSARRLFLGIGSSAWRTRAEAMALIAEIELGRSGPGLIRRGDVLAPELAAQGLLSTAELVRLHVARVAVRRGDLREAAQRISVVRVTARTPLAVRMVVRSARSELAVARGQSSAALREVRIGLGELHAWQSTFGSLDLQTFVIGRGRRLAMRGLGLAVDSGRARTLYEWSERARMLASRVRSVRPPADERIAADLAELRRINAHSDGLTLADPRRDRELRRRVRERSWRAQGSGEVNEPAGFDEVRAALGADSALVAWVVSRDRLVALVLTDTRASVVPLGSVSVVRDRLDGLMADLDVAAADLPDPIARAIRRSLAARLRTLSAALVQPLLPLLGDRQVVATPSGGLAGTPWTLLSGLVGRPVAVTPSATWWMHARRGGGWNDFTLDPARSAGFVAGPRVMRAAEEVAAAAATWGTATVLEGPAASEEAVTSLAGKVDVLHIASHGRHSADNPLFSGVELADGFWYGYDIDRLPRVPQVVILSACEVGRSSVRYGEELIGMTAAWLHAGVGCVVASPTAVNDHAAHDVLTLVHRRLAAGDPPAVALAAAVPEPTPDAAPAPFMCFGSGL